MFRTVQTEHVRKTFGTWLATRKKGHEPENIGPLLMQLGAVGVSQSNPFAISSGDTQSISSPYITRLTGPYCRGTSFEKLKVSDSLHQHWFRPRWRSFRKTGAKFKRAPQFFVGDEKVQLFQENRIKKWKHGKETITGLLA